MSGTGWLATAVFRRHLWAVRRRLISGLGLDADSRLAKRAGIYSPRGFFGGRWGESSSRGRLEGQKVRKNGLWGAAQVTGGGIFARKSGESGRAFWLDESFILAIEPAI